VTFTARGATDRVERLLQSVEARHGLVDDGRPDNTVANRRDRAEEISGIPGSRA